MTRPSQFPATKRPVLPLTPNAKIPTKLRQRFLNSFIDEYLIITADTKEAYEKVVLEEPATSRRFVSMASLIVPWEMSELTPRVEIWQISMAGGVAFLPVEVEGK